MMVGHILSRGTDEARVMNINPGSRNETRANITGMILAFFFIAICLAMAESAWGQQVTAAITGKVTDPSDTAIVGAKVEAKDTARGTVWTTETNAEGFYDLPRIPVGSYEDRVEMTGFQTALHSLFELVLNQTARLDF